MAKTNAKKNIRRGIVICGAYGMGNSGDEAILEAVMAQVRSIDPDAPLTVMSRSPAVIGSKFGVDSIHMFDMAAFLRAMKSARLYINGGGSLIQDVTSTRSLWYYLFTLAAAKILGCKVMMYGCGIGPVSRSANRVLVRRVLNRFVDTITLRETSSERELETFGVTKPEIILAADPVFSLPESANADIRKASDAFGIEEGGKYIGICLRKWPGYDEKAECFAAAADYAFEKYGLRPVFIPINCPGDVEAADMAAASVGCDNISVREQLPTAVAAELMRRMSVVISMRLHGLIFAVTQAVPIIGVSYDPKVTAFLEYIGQDNFADLEEITAEKLCAMLDSAVGADAAALSEAAHKLRQIESRNIEAARSLYKEG